MDFDLPPEIQELQAKVRDFVRRELIPIEMEINHNERVEPDILRPFQEKVKALGLWQVDVPKEFGGLGLTQVAKCVIEEEISQSKAMPYRLSALMGPPVGPILYRCNEEQKERFLKPVLRGEKRICFAQTEPDAGSDPAGMRTRAVRDGDHYVITGTKRFITGSIDADAAQVICVTDPEKGANGGISCIIVDMKAPGVKLVKAWQNMMDDPVGEIVFDGARVPVTDRIGEEGEGFKLAQEWLTRARIKQAAKALGIAQRCYDMSIDYAETRITGGVPLAQRQAVQLMIADCAMEIRSLRLMIYDVAWRSDLKQDIRNEAYMVKIMGLETVTRVIDRAIEIHGGIGLSKKLPLEYWYRQVRSSRIADGATEVLRWVLARNLARARKPKAKPNEAA